MSEAFTKGPWRIDDDIIASGIEIVVCRAPHPGISPKSAAAWVQNRHLLAAAPTMYEALNSLCNEVHGVLSLAGLTLRDEVGNTNFAVLQDRLNEARMVLVKARGAAP